MANFSTYKNLEFPETDEKYNISVFNKNNAIIDSEFHKLDLKNSNQDDQLSSEIERATTKENEIKQSLDNKIVEVNENINNVANNINNEIDRATESESLIKQDLDKRFEDLNNVDNTADIDKPVSTAQQNAIDEAVLNHNISSSAHSDIRELIISLTTRLNTLADSDDETLDQLSEIVAYIKNNKSLIEGVTTSKVSVSSIVDDLISTATDKPLSANQGRVLREMIEEALENINVDVDVNTEIDMTEYPAKTNMSNTDLLLVGDSEGTKTITYENFTNGLNISSESSGSSESGGSNGAIDVSLYPEVKELQSNSLLFSDNEKENGKCSITYENLKNNLEPDFNNYDEIESIASTDLIPIGTSDGTKVIAYKTFVDTFPMTIDTEPKDDDYILLSNSDGVKKISYPTFYSYMPASGMSVNSLYDMLDNNNTPVPVRRNVWRGKNLGTSITSEQYANIANGTFQGFFIGDYWVFNNIKYRIVDIDYYYYYNYSKTSNNIKHHLNIMPDSILTSSVFHSGAVTGSMLDFYIYKTTLTTTIPNIVNSYVPSSHIMNTYDIFAKAHSGSEVTAWIEGTSYFTLPLESMLVTSPQYTLPNRSNDYANTYATSTPQQLAAFRLCPQLVYKDNDNTIISAYWTRNVINASKGYCLEVGGVGTYACYGYGVHYSISSGVRPLFSIIG